jgi:hypothetical protein
MDHAWCILPSKKVSWFLELSRSLFWFIPNRLFCRVTDSSTRVTRRRTEPHRVTRWCMPDLPKKKRNVLMSFPRVPRPLCSWVPHEWTPSVPSLKARAKPMPPSLSRSFFSPLPSFLSPGEPGRLCLLLIAGAGAGQATKGELLLLLLSMIPFNSSRISSIKLFSQFLLQLREYKSKPDLLHRQVPSTSKPLNCLSPS